MWKRRWRYVIGAALLSVAVCSMTGCGGKGGQQKAVGEGEKNQVPQTTLRIFDKNAKDSFDDEIAKAIMEQTGLNIEVIDATDNPDEKVDMMLAYRDYPDIILIDLEDIGRYRENGCLVDISSYVDREGSNVKAMYGDTLNRLREPDGSLYYLSNWYGEDRSAVSAFQIRYDYLVSLVGRERADSDVPFTQEEFLELLRRFREKYPQIDGQDSIAFTLNLKFEYDNCFRGMYGMKLYYEDDGRLYHLVRHPRYLDMMNFLNTMYREGLLDKSWVVSNEQLFADNVKSGRVFATTGAYWDLAELNRYLQSTYGEDAVMLGYKVLGEGIDERETTYGGRNTIGWDAIAVTDHCENVQDAIRLIEFLSSEEGQYLMLWGIEGKDWTWENGVHQPSQEILDMLQEESVTEKTPIRRWTWFVKNGYGTDGTPYYLTECYMPGRIAQVSNRNMKYDYWDMALYSNLEPERGSREALKWKNIEDILYRAYPKMVNAASQEEMEQIYENMIESMEVEGLSEVEAVITEKYQNRLMQWGEDR